MEKRGVLLIRTLICIGLACASPVWGAAYPWLDPANTQVIVVKDGAVDMALRVAAIDRANRSIDEITYCQGSDADVGMPLLQAFRRAHARGVTGRHLFSRIPTRVTDPGGLTQIMLADPALKSPAQVLAFGGLRNLFTRFRVLDFVHEKLLIIDAGTPDEVIFIGDRNNHGDTLHDLGTGLILRRLDPTKPYLGDQLREAFADTWDPLTSVHPVSMPRKVAVKRIPPPDFNTQVPLRSEEQQREFREIDAALSRPVDAGAPLLSFESRPRRMRALNNELFRKLLTGLYRKGIFNREKLSSEIVDEAASVIARSKVVYASMMSVFPSAEIKEALKTALRNGAEVYLFTNSRETHSTLVPFGVAYDLGLPFIAELMDIKEGRLTVYVLDEKLLKLYNLDGRMLKYLHRKLLIADDHVLAGSDNFNVLSHKGNSELDVQSEDAEFASRMVSFVREDLGIFERMTCEMALTGARAYNWVKRGLNRIFMPFY